MRTIVKKSRLEHRWLGQFASASHEKGLSEPVRPSACCNKSPKKYNSARNVRENCRRKQEEKGEELMREQGG